MVLRLGLMVHQDIAGPLGLRDLDVLARRRHHHLWLLGRCRVRRHLVLSRHGGLLRGLSRTAACARAKMATDGNVCEMDKGGVRERTTMTVRWMGAVLVRRQGRPAEDEDDENNEAAEFDGIGGG